MSIDTERPEFSSSLDRGDLPARLKLLTLSLLGRRISELTGGPESPVNFHPELVEISNPNITKPTCFIVLADQHLGPEPDQMNSINFPTVTAKVHQFWQGLGIPAQDTNVVYLGDLVNMPYKGLRIPATSMDEFDTILPYMDMVGNGAHLYGHDGNHDRLHPDWYNTMRKKLVDKGFTFPNSVDDPSKPWQECEIIEHNGINIVFTPDTTPIPNPNYSSTSKWYTHPHVTERIAQLPEDRGPLLFFTHNPLARTLIHGLTKHLNLAQRIIVDAHTHGGLLNPRAWINEYFDFNANAMSAIGLKPDFVSGTTEDEGIIEINSRGMGYHGRIPRTEFCDVIFMVFRNGERKYSSRVFDLVRLDILGRPY